MYAQLYRPYSTIFLHDYFVLFSPSLSGCLSCMIAPQISIWKNMYT